MKRAVVLLSGGMDSATCLALASAEAFEVFALSVSYGQRHVVELECAQKLAESFRVQDYRTAEVNLRLFGGSALTDEIEVPKAGPSCDVPVTYVPARNTIFLSLALAYAEVVGARTIFAGMNAVDYSGYPDCRPEYVAAFEQMANLATKATVSGGQRMTIATPLMQLTKPAIIEAGEANGVDFAMTTSCYDPRANGAPCRECDACRLRRDAFAALGKRDPRETLFE
ncbi:MAG: 7-cyano-7-deazaguanine synthase QueC [Fimbriimonadaceae bacterium]|nr:7-cyano-7-deazaguanine synthase QueC [Fimbriimonadaceae bacterium]